MNTRIEINYRNNIADLFFFNSKGNSLCINTINKLTKIFNYLNNNSYVRVILIHSLNEFFFCSGIYINDLYYFDNIKDSNFFFLSFSKLIISMITCSKLIVCFVSGKVIGGGVGVLSSCDYVIGKSNVLIKLSELSLGIGPFIIEPIIRHKIGFSNFMELFLNPEKWFSFFWCKNVGLISEITYDFNIYKKNGIFLFLEKLSNYNISVINKMKKISWNNNNICYWIKNLEEKALINAKLVLLPSFKETLNKFINKK